MVRIAGRAAKRSRDDRVCSLSMAVMRPGDLFYRANTAAPSAIVSISNDTLAAGH
jgi:hypothetical protein